MEQRIHCSILKSEDESLQLQNKLFDLLSDSQF